MSETYRSKRLSLADSKLDHIQVNEYHRLSDYYYAISGEGPLAYEWKDKPHRLIYDLIRRIAELEQALNTAYEDAAKAAESELLEDPQPGEDFVYQQAITDAAQAIRVLKREVGG